AVGGFGWWSDRLHRLGPLAVSWRDEVAREWGFHEGVGWYCVAATAATRCVDRSTASRVFVVGFGEVVVCESCRAGFVADTKRFNRRGPRCRHRHLEPERRIPSRRQHPPTPPQNLTLQR